MDDKGFQSTFSKVQRDDERRYSQLGEKREIGGSYGTSHIGGSHIGGSHIGVSHIGGSHIGGSQGAGSQGGGSQGGGSQGGGSQGGGSQGGGSHVYKSTYERRHYDTGEGDFRTYGSSQKSSRMKESVYESEERGSKVYESGSKMYDSGSSGGRKEEGGRKYSDDKKKRFGRNK